MLEVTGATVRFGAATALDDVSLTVADGKVAAVLGPSGSGKTTLLRAIAGLQPLDAGTVAWDGEDLTRVPPHRRSFGLMFQDYALFPHLNVGGNVEFGLRMQRLPAVERQRRVREALLRVQLPGFQARLVATLSGGEAQRVALARALAPGPRMLALDEPLGSLDRALREQLIADLRSLLTRLEVTTLYVTHDQSEAFGLADQVIVIDDGRVLQTGTPEQVWGAPASEQVARFLGLRNVIDGNVIGLQAGTSVGVVPVPAGTEPGPGRFVLRPGAFHLHPQGTIEGVVVSRVFRGDTHLLEVEANGTRLEIIIPRAPLVGERVRLTVDAAGVSRLPDPSTPVAR
jgi:thiamine transport system ATP-binding protein